MQHTPRFTTTPTTIPPLRRPIPRPPGKHYRHAVTVQVPRTKLSINSRKVVNIQTRESTPIYHKQLHGIRTSFTSSSQSQVAWQSSLSLLLPTFIPPPCQQWKGKSVHSHWRKVYLQIIPSKSAGCGWVVDARRVRNNGSHYTTALKCHNRGHSRAPFTVIIQGRGEPYYPGFYCPDLIPRTLNSNALG